MTFFEGFLIHLFEIEIFCNILNLFTVTFDQFNTSLLKNIHFFKSKMKKKNYTKTQKIK